MSFILASKFLKNPLNIKGIPFIAYSFTVCVLPLRSVIVVVISEVGNSESNSFAVGVMEVFNLVCPEPAGVPNCNAEPALIPTLAP